MRLSRGLSAGWAVDGMALAGGAAAGGAPLCDQTCDRKDLARAGETRGPVRRGRVTVGRTGEMALDVGRLTHEPGISTSGLPHDGSPPAVIAVLWIGAARCRAVNLSTGEACGAGIF